MPALDDSRALKCVNSRQPHYFAVEITRNLRSLLKSAAHQIVQPKETDATLSGIDYRQY